MGSVTGASGNKSKQLHKQRAGFKAAPKGLVGSLVVGHAMEGPMLRHQATKGDQSNQTALQIQIN